MGYGWALCPQITRLMDEYETSIGPTELKLTLCLRYECKTETELNFAIFEDISMKNHINGELSTRPFQ